MASSFLRKEEKKKNSARNREDGASLGWVRLGAAPQSRCSSRSRWVCGKGNWASLLGTAASNSASVPRPSTLTDPTNKLSHVLHLSTRLSRSLALCTDCKTHLSDFISLFYSSKKWVIEMAWESKMCVGFSECYCVNRKTRGLLSKVSSLSK